MNAFEKNTMKNIVRSYKLNEGDDKLLTSIKITALKEFCIHSSNMALQREIETIEAEFFQNNNEALAKIQDEKTRSQ